MRTVPNYPIGAQFDRNAPFNQPDGDGLYVCPECGDRCHNLVKESEPIIDCFDHTEDGDMRAEARKLKSQIKELASRIRYKEGVLAEIAREAGECLERVKA